MGESGSSAGRFFPDLVAALVFLLTFPALPVSPAIAAFTDTPTPWTNFDNPGFIANYTYLGQPIADMETSADTSQGPASVPPADTDLSSGSPGSDPGPYDTPAYGYYDGGTPYDPSDPSTLEDDYVLFRMRVRGAPSQGQAFSNYHWNVLVDLDADGYKEYWVDLFGGYSSGSGYDQMQILYDDRSRQDIDDPDASRVEEFKGYYDETVFPDSFTRAVATSDGTGDYWIEMQIPMTAFNDQFGNQVMFPDSPVAFVFSTGASNQNPLQKDFMMDLDFLTLADPITFGDIVTLNGEPRLSFTDAGLDPVFFYHAGDDVYTLVNAPRANTGQGRDLAATAGSAVVTAAGASFQSDGLQAGDWFEIFSGPDSGIYQVVTVDSETQLTLDTALSSTGANLSYAVLDTLTVTVTDPATGDDEILTLTETTSTSGLFTNRGGTSRPVSSDVANGWIGFVETSGFADDALWVLTYSSATGDWAVTKDGAPQTVNAAAGTGYVSDGGEVVFTLYEDSPADGDTIAFRTFAADRLPSEIADVTPDNSDDSGTLEVNDGDIIYFSYTTPGSATYTAEADIVSAGEPYIQFTRANGLPSDDFRLTGDPSTSDLLYVTVTFGPANTDPGTAETISVTLSGSDSQTLTLTETGPDTGIFRNMTKAEELQTQIYDGAAAADDHLWEDVDEGVVTATYTYAGTDYSTAASLFATEEGGRANFTNGAGTRGIEQYAPGQPVFLRVEDDNACSTADPATGVETVTVTVTSDVGDSETVTLYETFPGSQVFMNRLGDLETTLGDSWVTSPSSDFSGLAAGDPFVIASGPDTGTYAVAALDGGDATRLQLDTVMTATRTAASPVSFTAAPLFAATSDGTVDPAEIDDGYLEALHEDTLTVTYDDSADCAGGGDGDTDPPNDLKIDTAVFNAPSIVINEVFFHPDPTAGTAGNPVPAQTEFFQLYNASGSPVNVTGYAVEDEDGFSYTVPQLGGSDVVLQPGDRIYVFLFEETFGGTWDYFDGADTYYFFADGVPDDRFADPDDADPADQLTLYDAGGTTVDYVAWSSTLAPSLDFRGDDGPALTPLTIWTDDAYRDVGVGGVNPIPAGESIVRSDDGVTRTDGYDTNQPSDWIYADASGLFGPGGPVITDALVTSFTAAVDRGRVVVSWETAGEIGTVGFHLHRREADGTWRRVNDALLPALVTAPQGGAYEYVDEGARPGGTYAYLLEEVEAGGGGNRYGPYTVEAMGRASRLSPSPYGRAPWSPSPVAKARSGARGRAQGPAAATRPGGGDAIKITVRDEGLHYVDAADIARHLGIPAGKARSLVRRGRLALTSRGGQVAWLPAEGGAGLFFYGSVRHDNIADYNVYWLFPGDGLAMAVSDAPALPEAAPDDAFTATFHEEVDRWGMPAAFSDPGDDFWLWDYFYAATPGLDSRVFPFTVKDVAPTGADASLTVALKGGASLDGGLPHRARIALNGTELGDCRFLDTEAADCTFAFSPWLLTEGENTLTVAALLEPSAPYSVFYLDSFDVACEREYRARGGGLLFRTDGREGPVAVEGFGSADVLLLDVTLPSEPVLVGGATAKPGAAGYSLTFQPFDGERTYLAVESVAARVPDETAAVIRGSLSQRDNAADYVIIGPAEFADAAAPLAAWRSSRGHRVLYAPVGEVVDEFGLGFFGPGAIRRFLAFAAANWQSPPRYVLLLGEGNYDYRDLGGFGENLVPTALVATPHGLSASDGPLADSDGDGRAEMAIGRLPILDAAELGAAVDKIIDYEGSSAEGRALFLADDPEEGADFHADSDRVAALVPARWDVVKLHLGTLSKAETRSLLFEGLAGGAALLNYIGHGGLDRFAAEGLLTTADVPFVPAGLRAPVVTAMTCAAGQFAVAGYDSLAEALVLAGGRGAAAVWAPSGYSVNEEARRFDEALYRSIFRKGRTILGDALLDAAAEYRAFGTSPHLPLVYNLLGDPALRIEE